MWLRSSQCIACWSVVCEKIIVIGHFGGRGGVRVILFVDETNHQLPRVLRVKWNAKNLLKHSLPFDF